MSKRTTLTAVAFGVGILTLATVQNGGDGTMAGIVAGCRIVKTRKGDRMAVFMLEDQAGSVEVVVYPEPYKQFASFIENDRMVVVTGRVEVDDERAKMRASDVKDLKQVTERFVKEVCVTMQAPPHGHETFRALSDVFLRHRGDKRVQFELRVRRDSAGPLLVRAEVPQLRVRPSDELVLAVERICGQGSVVLR